MAKFRCVCGETLRISGDIPNPIESHVVADTALMGFQGPVTDEDGIYRAVLTLSTPMLRCPVCDRLWMFWDWWDGPPTVYTFESQMPPGY